jgi:hypothetical protein
MNFVIGETYTRDEIHHALDGEKVTYLPQHDKRIVCGCFIPAHGKNPKAPDEVLVGTGPLVEKKAAMLCAQDEAIPVFLKRVPKQWEYRGEYRVEGYSKSPSLLRKKEAEAGRSGLTMVIWLGQSP